MEREDNFDSIKNAEQESAKVKRRHWFRSSMGVQSKFLLGTGLILFTSCIVSAFVIYFHEKLQMEEQAFAKSELVMAAVDASRDYVREELRPAMYKEMGEDYFVLEAMSTSFVGRSVMDRFAPALEDFQYRRVAVNARNPKFEANELEREKIEYFEQYPEKLEWQGVVNTRGQDKFKRFRPVVFEEECMRCHGDPGDAPKVLLNIYGDERGFGRRAGELAGVSMVSVPVEAAMSQVREKAITVFLIFFFGLSIVFIALSFFFNRMVVTNLRGLLEVFRDEKDQQAPALEYLPRVDLQKKDELEELTEAALNMADHLRLTREQLRQYALNLEKKVEERTRALRASEERLREQVSARNHELQTLNSLAELTTQAVSLSEILPRVLRRTLEIFPARGAGIYFYDEDRNRLRLHYHEDSPGLVEEINIASKYDENKPSSVLEHSIIEAVSGKFSYFDCLINSRCLNIPLRCRGNVLGVMTFTGIHAEEISSELYGLLSSIGHQIGIAVESLQNMEKLLQSKDLLQSVFDGITDQVVMLDRDYRIKMVNKAYTRRYDVATEEVLGRRCFDVHGSGERPCPECVMEEVLRTRTPVVHETRCPELHGIYQVHCYPNLDESGEVESVIRYVKDITDQKLMEHKIQQTEKLVAMGQLAAGVAHEINNPLGVILCYVELLKRQLTELPQGRNDLGTIEKQARNCKRIVSDLLDFARSGETSKHNASLNQTVRDVLGMVSEQFKKQGVKIELELEEIPVFKMDTNKIKQVFMNLMINSRQAMEGRNGRMHISTRHVPEKNLAKAIFWDNGEGIPEYMRDKIFDPFFSTKRTGEGTGLGLSVSYGIIREHGGDISVESKPGEWTRFIVDLPINTESANEAKLKKTT